MSDPSPAKGLADGLDAVLREQIRHEETKRDLNRKQTEIDNILGPIYRQAQRLRMAMFALDGTEADFGDANKANHQRVAELRGGSQ